MNLEILLAGVLPLVVFVLADIYLGAKKAIVAAVGLAVCLLLYHYLRFGEFDELLILEVGLLGGLGLISVKMNNPRYFKFQPVVVGACMAGVLIWHQFFDQPLMVKMIPHAVKMMPDMKETLSSPVLIAKLERISAHLIGLFLLHSALVAFSALKMKNVGWLAMRLSIYPLLIGLMIVNSFF